MFSVGLTGGIASGKSRVLQRFARRGFHTLDLDRVTHDVLAPAGTAYGDVVAAFGGEILAADGTIDRRVLGRRVFGDPAALARLNALVHPRVREAEVRWRASRPAGPGAVAVVDAALLVEVGMHLRFDRVVVAHCGEDEQVRRLMARDGLAEPDARARLRAQMPSARKRRFAHLEVDTSGRPDDTDAVADAVAARLEDLARHPATAAFPEAGARGALSEAPAGPRGLDPLPVLAAAARLGAVDLPALAGTLVPPATGPWYDAGRPDEPVGAEAAAVAAALWTRGLRGSDPDYAVGVAASLATLTHREGPGVADACLFTFALHHALSEGAPPRDVAPAWVQDAARRGSARPSGRLDPVWRAVARFPRDVGAAKDACAAEGGDALLAGVLVRAALGEEAASAAIEEVVRVLSALPR
jgi:dephospho-CoA kinase